MTQDESDSDVRGQIDRPVDLRPSDLQSPITVDVRIYPAAIGQVEASVLLNGTQYLSRGNGPTVGHALMVAGALMAGIEVLPNVELRRRPWWRRS